MELCIMIQMLQNVLIKVFFEELTHLTKSVQQKQTDIICVYRHRNDLNPFYGDHIIMSIIFTTRLERFT